MNRIVIGFDPGHKGGIAILRPGREPWVYPMPIMGKEIDWQGVTQHIRLLSHRNGSGEVIPYCAFVERCHSMPKQGVASTFKFGTAYGGILGILGALGIPTQLVSPSAWKKVILAGTAKDKPAAIAYCRRRWPSVSLIPEGCRKAHDGMADALCIAAYGETVLNGTREPLG